MARGGQHTTFQQVLPCSTAVKKRRIKDTKPYYLFFFCLRDLLWVAVILLYRSPSLAVMIQALAFNAFLTLVLIAVRQLEGIHLFSLRMKVCF